MDLSTRRILILGGTTEARLLAERLAARDDISVTVSLAGRTRNPLDMPATIRVGGFGGADGLAEYLRAEAIDALIDATHPFAAAMSFNAAEAARLAGVPLLALARPAWERQPGDIWREAANVTQAVELLGAAPRRVLVALGRNEVRALEAAPQHFYLVRSVDPVEPPLRWTMPATSSPAARFPRRMSGPCLSSTVSTPCSPRTAAARLPTARSPRRGRSASR